MDKEEFKKLAKNHRSVLKNSKSLAQNWVPGEKEELLCRDEEIEDLFAVYYPIINEGRTYSANALLLGPGGIGKTLTAKYFGKRFQEEAKRKMNFKTEYYDCLQTKTKSAILRDIITKLKLHTGHGFSDNELLKQILIHLRNKDEYLMLILDEIHNLPQEDIVALLNASIGFGPHNSSFSLLCITRGMDWMKIRNDRMQSRIQKQMHLKPYEEEAAYKILKYRAQLAFHPGVVEEDALQQLAEIVKMQNMRHGIDALRAAGHYCDKHQISQIDAEIVLKTKNEVNPEFMVENLEGLSNDEFLALLAIVRVINQSQDHYATIGKAFREYQVVCEEFDYPARVVQTFRRYVKDIAKRKIVSSRTAKMRGKKKGRQLQYRLVDIDSESFIELLENKLNSGSS